MLEQARIGQNRLEYAGIDWNRPEQAGIDWNRQEQAGIGRVRVEQAGTGLFPNIPAYFRLFYHIPVYSRLFQPIPAHSPIPNLQFGMPNCAFYPQLDMLSVIVSSLLIHRLTLFLHILKLPWQTINNSSSGHRIDYVPQPQDIPNLEEPQDCIVGSKETPILLKQVEFSCWRSCIGKSLRLQFFCYCIISFKTSLPTKTIVCTGGEVYHINLNPQHYYLDMVPMVLVPFGSMTD